MKLPTSPICFHLDGVAVTVHDITRFWAKLNLDGPVHPVLGTNCHLWTGAPNHNGYGRLHVGGRSGKYLMANRLAYAIKHGPPKDLALHRCDTPLCVRLDHLFEGTQRDNVLDMVAKGRVAAGDSHGSHTKPENIARGERHGNARLKASDIPKIRAASPRHSYGVIAKDFGISSEHARDIILRRRWKHIP